jgi:hypothetical protein
MDAGHADGNDGEFGSRKESIDQDQDDNGEKVDPNGYHKKKTSFPEEEIHRPMLEECPHYPSSPES